MTEYSKYTELLVQILAIPSLSRNEDTRSTFLQSWFESEGLKVKRKKNNLLVSSGGAFSKAKILLNSHIDTVPPGEGWQSDPFLPVVEKNKITGLGSNDAGASVVSMIGAFMELFERGEADGIVLLISAEEEVSGKHGIEYVLPKLKGLKFALVGEPTGMQAAIAERGLMVIDAAAKGESGHAARREGVNAIYNALQDIEKIRGLSFDDHSKWLDDPSVTVTMINAGKSHNVVPDLCEFVIDVRSNDKYSNERLLRMLKERCDSELIERSLRLKSSSLDKNHPAYKVLKKMGLKSYGSPTLSDMALLRIPAIKIGPGDSARSHTANEYILKEEIYLGIKKYVELLKELLKIEL